MIRMIRRNNVAIPSIQVGFSILFVPEQRGVPRRVVAIPSIQVGFSIKAVKNLNAILVSRNPFYSGRFFHWREEGPYNPRGKESQSLLFRSVFPLLYPEKGRNASAYVAIPSIQVGFSIALPDGTTLVTYKMSQSLLFRSVFPFRDESSTYTGTVE